MGPKVYDSRIRPSGLNGTGKILFPSKFEFRIEG